MLSNHSAGINHEMAIAAVSLAACASGVSVSHENVAHSYEAKALHAVATGDNELRTVIVGDPFGMPKDASDKAVLANLQAPGVKPRLNLMGKADPFVLLNRRTATDDCNGSKRADIDRRGV